MSDFRIQQSVFNKKLICLTSEYSKFVFKQEISLTSEYSKSVFKQDINLFDFRIQQICF